MPDRPNAKTMESHVQRLLLAGQICAEANPDVPGLFVSAYKLMVAAEYDQLVREILLASSRGWFSITGFPRINLQNRIFTVVLHCKSYRLDICRYVAGSGDQRMGSSYIPYDQIIALRAYSSSEYISAMMECSVGAGTNKPTIEFVSYC